jgi:hypothetical protein
MPIIAPTPPKFPENQWAEESSHWYDATTGEARYQITGKNGKIRNTTLADARKGGLVPSVTTIAQIEAKPQLTRWLVEQGMMACLTLPRSPGETDTEFMARALEDSKAQSKAAAERGSYLHGILEEVMRDGIKLGNMQWLDDYMAYCKPVVDWLHANFEGYTWNVERTIPPHLGFGGKIDLTGTHPEKPSVTIDYKCKDFDDPKKKLAYDEHCTQLATYSNAMYPSDTQRRCVNIFISSTVPGLFVVHEWTPRDIERGWAAFQAMLQLWRIRKDFV